MMERPVESVLRELGEPRALFGSLVKETGCLVMALLAAGVVDWRR